MDAGAGIDISIDLNFKGELVGIIIGSIIYIAALIFFYSIFRIGGWKVMIRLFKNDKKICECCDNDSTILIDFFECNIKSDLGTRLYLCNECKDKLTDLLKDGNM